MDHGLDSGIQWCLRTTMELQACCVICVCHTPYYAKCEEGAEYPGVYHPMPKTMETRTLRQPVEQRGYQSKKWDVAMPKGPQNRETDPQWESVV